MVVPVLQQEFTPIRSSDLDVMIFTGDNGMVDILSLDAWEIGSIWLDV